MLYGMQRMNRFCHIQHTYMELHCDFFCIYFDLPKAFDRVSHQELIYKISNIGIQGNLLLWIIDFFITQKAESNV